MDMIKDADIEYWRDAGYLEISELDSLQTFPPIMIAETYRLKRKRILITVHLAFHTYCTSSAKVSK
jgi:hypothetical protein